jgi:hemolysin activation/secretion protein
MTIPINLLKITKIPLLSTAYLLSITSIVKAQSLPSPPLPPKPQPVEPETLPPIEEILPELQSPQPDNSNTINETLKTVFVQKFEIIGSTVFTPEELAAVLKPYTLRRLSFTELLAAQETIDRLYFQNGYITSGTILPPQKLENGIITIEVIEGSVEEIKVTGLKRLNDGYVRDRLKIATNAPLNRGKLLNALQLLKLDPLIANLAAELTAGTRKGSSILEIELQEADPFDATLSFDNFRAAAVGTDRRSIRLTHRNLLGFGDRLSVGYLNTDGSNSLDNFNYTFPINPDNGTLDFRLSYSDSEIITSPFDSFDIESENINYDFTYRQPLIQKPTKDVAIGLTFAKSNSEVTVKDEPAQLSEGAESDGTTNTSVIRFFQEYTSRDADEVLAFLSQFSIGINALGATANYNEQPDSRFLAWRGQAQYLKLLNPTFTLLLRSDLQLANDALLPTEQFSLGGGLNIRGYRQDALLADNGWFNSAEVRAEILNISKWETSLQLTPFVDFGAVWNSDGLPVEPGTNTLVSTGIGLRLQVGDDFTSRIDWGIPLVDLETDTDIDGNSLQEQGIYFSLELKPF